jgi:hypothetical protein
MTTTIREAQPGDLSFVIELMVAALGPYYGGDHRAHAERIFSTHISVELIDSDSFLSNRKCTFWRQTRPSAV